MNVVRLSQYKARQTVRLLEALAAQAEAGQITGIALCFKRADGSEEFVSSDFYATSPDSAAAATLRLSMRLAGSHGEYDASP
jgi:hypothetical protein